MSENRDLIPHLGFGSPTLFPGRSGNRVYATFTRWFLEKFQLQKYPGKNSPGSVV